MKPSDKGLHHITVIAGPAQQNHDFYTQKLGLRMVLKSVNQDDTGTWHLFFANGTGEPGSSLTFFPFKHASHTETGTGEATVVSFSVPDTSRSFWLTHLEKVGVKTDAIKKRFNLEVLPFKDPDGLRLELIFDPMASQLDGWNDGSVPAEHAIRGFWSTTLYLTETETTARILEDVLDFEPTVKEGSMHLYRTGSNIGNAVILEKAEQARQVYPGRGTVHHVAFRARDRNDLEAMRQKVLDLNLGIHPTDVIDRHVFESVYFRTPGGVLFEIATDPPGYKSVVEKEEEMGKTLFLPPWLESKRSEIEAKLDPLVT